MDKVSCRNLGKGKTVTVPGALGAAARLSEVSRSLNELLPGRTFDLLPSNIAVVTNVPLLARRLLGAIEHGIGRSLASARIFAQALETPYPDLSALAQSLDGLWIVCGADRYEFGGSAFSDWSDRHRALFGRVPVHGICVLRVSQLASWNEPVLHDNVSAGERSIAITPLLLDFDAPAFGGGAQLEALQLVFVEKLLLLSMRHAAKHRSYLDVAAAWDVIASAAFDAAPPAVTAATQLEAALIRIAGVRRMRDTARAAAKHVDAAFDSAAIADAAYTPVHDLEPLSKKVAVLINDGRSGFISVPTANDTTPFALEFQQVRQRALRFIDLVIGELTKLGHKSEANVFAATRRQFLEDVKVILLGAFSSGKTTFLNSLLGLDEETNALPTSGRPETATITEVVEGKEDAAVFEFHDCVGLVLFQQSSHSIDRWKLNREEMQSFLSWLAEEIVHVEQLGSARFTPKGVMAMSPRGHAITRSDIEFFRDLIAQDTAYIERRLLERASAVCRIENIRFRRDPKPPLSRKIAECLKWVKAPVNALRIKKLEVRRASVALNGLRMVDTPGTDSLISHHHTLARSYIEEYSTSPVIYLFAASPPASEEDAKNIAFLKELSSDRTRLFFVINKKSLVTGGEDGEREIRGAVNRRLRNAKIEGKRVYYIDALGARTKPDSEWIALVSDLRAFVRDRATDMLVEAMRMKLRAPLDGLLTYHRELVRKSGFDAEDLAKTIAAWTRSAKAIAVVMARFDEEVASVEQRLFKRAASDFHLETNEIDGDLAAFDCGAWLTSKKDTKVREIQSIIAPLAEWPERLKANLQSASRVLHAFLAQQLVKESSSLSVVLTNVDVPADFHAFTIAEIQTEANSDVHYSFKSYTGWIENKVARLRELVGREANGATRKVGKAFNDIVTAYRAQGHALQVRAESFARTKPQGGDSEAMQNAQATIDFLERTLREYLAVDQ